MLCATGISLQGLGRASVCAIRSYARMVSLTFRRVNGEYSDCLAVAVLTIPVSYCTMDYILLATLVGLYLLLLITYDIACQYHKNFLKRMPDFPPCMQLKPDIATKVRWAIPKKH